MADGDNDKSVHSTDPGDYQGGLSVEQTARLQEEYRLAAQVMRITNRLEEAVSKLKNGFMDNTHFLETKATISRLHTETMDVALDIAEKLDK